MKFICDRQAMWESVSNASRAVLAKSSVPALEGLMLTAEKETLTITGYDLEIGIIAEMEANIIEPGSVVLNARLLGEMLRKLVSDEISFSCDSSYMTEIKGGVTHFTLTGIDPDQYPIIPIITTNNTMAIPAQALRSCIEMTQFAIAQYSTKPVNTGSLFNVENNVLDVVSVDGYRLALRKEKIKATGDMKFVVPGKTLADLCRMIGDYDDDALIQVGRKHAIFKVNGYTVMTRQLEGQFLDYKTSIPKDPNTFIEVNVRQLASAVDRVSLMITDRLLSPLRVTFYEDLITIKCTTASGNAYDESPCKRLSGDDFSIGFNNKYLLDAIRATGCDEVLLKLSGPLAPMIIAPKEGDDFMFLVLPVRIKNEE